jgi:hypothetical protein
MAPEPIHRNVKEILQKLFFFCPGCNVRYPYDDVFEHANACEKVPNSAKRSKHQLSELLAKKVGSKVLSGDKGAQSSFMGTSIGNEVFVLDNDSFKVFVYNLLTHSSHAYDMEY